MTQPASDKHISYIERVLAGERPAPKNWRHRVVLTTVVDIPRSELSSLIARIRQQEAVIKRMDEAVGEIEELKGMDELIYLDAKATIIERLQDIARAARKGKP